MSKDDGRTWTAPERVHRDTTLSPHGFVSLFEADGSAMAAWLHEVPHGSGGHGGAVSTRLRFTRLDTNGRAAPDAAIDTLACDCCQTDVAETARGPVVVYRDRTRDEIRDIAIVRHENGAWTEPRIVHDDGWRIDGCPVNGPAVAARGEEVAVAWYTGVGDTARVRIAFSNDNGDSFGAPVQVDDGDPIGRVDVALIDAGLALVTWIEREGEQAYVMARAVGRDNGPGPTRKLGLTRAERASGFPRMALAGADAIVAWTVPREGISVVRLPALR
jgi:hypothetical protein